MTIFLGIASLLFSSGCEVSNATSLVGKTEAGPAHAEIDAGVIFGDRSSYLCIPLSRFGIASSGEIESLDSSCECVKPTLVHYSDTAATVADGLLLEFVAEDHASDSTPQPMHLAVDVRLTFSCWRSFSATDGGVRAHWRRFGLGLLASNCSLPQLRLNLEMFRQIR